jgi:nucleoside-diphosphate-sugar epimerase
MKVLVTGHKGYIGSHLYKDLINLGHDVTGIDIKENKNIDGCLPSSDFDFVFHLAAIPSVQFSTENPSYTLRNNVYCTSILLEWSKSHSVKRFIFSSSAAAKDPSSPYGLQKRMSEMECKLFSQVYGLDTVCLRYYNVYSEDQKYGGAYSTAISAWMEMLRAGSPLRIDGDGEQTRDFVHVKDVVDANIFVMQNKNDSDESLSGKILDVGTGIRTSLNKIKKFINETHKTEWIYSKERIGDIKHSVAETEEIKKIIGWCPSISIEEGLTRCFKKVN